MRMKILSILAAVVLVAGCSSDDVATGTQGSTVSTGSVQGPVPGTQQDLNQTIGDRVFFDTDQFTLRPDARATVDRWAAWLQQYPNVGVTIEGHADERGTREYNIALSARRSTVSREFLISQGVDASRIATIAYGKERPVALCEEESCWAQNRRSVTVITGGAQG